MAKAKPCPVCTCPAAKAHADDDCVRLLIDSGLLVQSPIFTRKVAPVRKWTEQQREFAETIALQAVQWKRAELEDAS